MGVVCVRLVFLFVLGVFGFVCLIDGVLGVWMSLLFGVWGVGGLDLVLFGLCCALCGVFGVCVVLVVGLG